MNEILGFVFQDPLHEKTVEQIHSVKVQDEKIKNMNDVVDFVFQ